MSRHPPFGTLCTAAFAAALAACALGLGACGGGSTASTGAPTSATSGSGPASLGESQPRKAAGTGAERRQAGRAAPFVAPESDNSIPTFGAEAGASDRIAAEAALRTYLHARAVGEWSAACAALAATLARQVEALGAGKGCVAAYASLAEGAAASSRATSLEGHLLSLRARGPSGFALFYGPGKQEYVMPMAREGGAWKVTQVAPLAYPLGSEAASRP